MGRLLDNKHQVKRFMKRIFELRPVFPKYSRIWDVNQVLNYLKSMGSSVSISLKMLTLRFTMLLCLLAGQRCQTVHAMEIDYMDLSESKCILLLIIFSKTLSQELILNPLEYFAFEEDEQLCIISNLNDYLARTKPLRKRYSQLLISYVKSSKPAAQNTVARWIKSVLQKAGINVDIFGAHSVRAASASPTKVKGLPLDMIISAAGWPNESTFEKFYSEAIDSIRENFGQVLLKN